MTSKEIEIIRPTANYHPSLWGDQFLVYEEVRTQQQRKKMTHACEIEYLCVAKL